MSNTFVNLASIPFSYSETQTSIIELPKKNKQLLAVKYGDRLIWLNKELNCFWHKESGYYHLENNYLNIHAYGKTKEEAEEDFSDIFSYEIDEYVKCDIDDLAGNAIELRKRLLEYIDGRI